MEVFVIKKETAVLIFDISYCYNGVKCFVNYTFLPDNILSY